jgi:hypothetical protein
LINLLSHYKRLCYSNAFSFAVTSYLVQKKKWSAAKSRIFDMTSFASDTQYLSIDRKEDFQVWMFFLFYGLYG